MNLKDKPRIFFVNVGIVMLFVCFMFYNISVEFKGYSPTSFDAFAVIVGLLAIIAQFAPRKKKDEAPQPKRGFVKRTFFSVASFFTPFMNVIKKDDASNKDQGKGDQK